MYKAIDETANADGFDYAEKMYCCSIALLSNYATSSVLSHAIKEFLSRHLRSSTSLSTVNNITSNGVLIQYPCIF